jgi:hypothetical protein
MAYAFARRRIRWQSTAAVLAVLSLQLGACVDHTGPVLDRFRPGNAIPQALTVSTGRIASNAVYQVRKESGGSAYDPETNHTYITWNGPDMDIYVRAYHNGTATWSSPKLAKAWTHYAGGARWAYHNYSTMVLGPDGKLHIFQADHARALYEIVAPTAHSLTGNWIETRISSDRTAYPSVNVVGHSIYVFYVHDYSATPDTYRTLRFIRKTWSGTNWSAWSAPRTVIDTRRKMGTERGEGDLYDEVYQQSVSLFDDKLWITFNLAGGAESCPSNSDGHNCGAKDLYLVGLDVRNPSAPGNLYSVGGSNLGSTVTCVQLGDCPEFLRIGTGARVESFPADPQSSEWGLSHPVAFSMAGWLGTTNTYVIAYDLGREDGDHAIRLARFSNGTWKHMTVDQGKGLNLRDIAVRQGNAVELAYLTGAPVTLRARQILPSGGWPGTVTQVHADLRVPMNGTPKPDRVSFLQIAEGPAISGRALRMLGATFNFAARQTDYSGDWNVFGLYAR